MQVRFPDGPDAEKRAARAEKSRRRRRARLANARHEPYTLQQILGRDGYICHICSGPIDPHAKWPEPGAATIDHVVPLSTGGDDTPDNVAPAHFACNLRKSNKPGEALTAVS